MARVIDPGGRRPREFGRAAPALRLFNPATPARRRLRKGLKLLAFAAAGLIAAALVVFDEKGGARFLAVVPAGVAVVMTVLGVVALLRRPSPTVTCLGCAAVGWVEDVKAADGACPHCGGRKFRAAGRRRGGLAAGMAIVTGIELCAGDFSVDGDGDGDGGGGGDGGDGGGDGGGGGD